MAGFDFRLSIKAYGDKKIKFSRARRRLRSMQGLLAEVGKISVKQIKYNLWGNLLRKKTGRLRRSIGYKTLMTNAGWEVEIGSTKDPVPYTALWEYGGWAGPNRSVYHRARHILSKSIDQKYTEIRKLMISFLRKLFR